MLAYKKGILVILALIAATGVAMAYLGTGDSGTVKATGQGAQEVSDGLVTMAAELVQTKILKGSDGRVGVALNISAADLPRVEARSRQSLDWVVVLDRSGSMEGQKLEDARASILKLLSGFSAEDRFALVAYSDEARILSTLRSVDETQRSLLMRQIQVIHADGGTNLGGGLQAGISLLMQSKTSDRQRKLILVSDGLANQGITDPAELGKMAAAATDHAFAVSTVGVGYDFNETLMTLIADQGVGQYYFLENPQAFARVFEKEFQDAHTVAAAAMQIRVPLRKGLRVVDAGGYPIRQEEGFAVIQPGDLLSGQSRKLFLTLELPSDREGDYRLEEIRISYRKGDDLRHLIGDARLTVACVADQREAVASIAPAAWTNQVLQEDFGQLKEEVAEAIRNGEKDSALIKIREYEDRNRLLNSSVGSQAVAQNLDEDVGRLRADVEETFAGSAPAVAEKRKQQSKALQFESYNSRRDKK